jgi:hypothetical protein
MHLISRFHPPHRCVQGRCQRLRSHRPRCVCCVLWWAPTLLSMLVGSPCSRSPLLGGCWRRLPPCHTSPRCVPLSSGWAHWCTSLLVYFDTYFLFFFALGGMHVHTPMHALDPLSVRTPGAIARCSLKLAAILLRRTGDSHVRACSRLSGMRPPPRLAAPPHRGSGLALSHRLLFLHAFLLRQQPARVGSTAQGHAPGTGEHRVCMCVCGGVGGGGHHCAAFQIHALRNAIAVHTHALPMGLRQGLGTA